MVQRNGDEASRHGIKSYIDDGDVADDVVGKRDEAVCLAAKGVDYIRCEKEIDAELNDESNEVRYQINCKTLPIAHVDGFSLNPIALFRCCPLIGCAGVMLKT